MNIKNLHFNANDYVYSNLIDFERERKLYNLCVYAYIIYVRT